jgi:hypothetical protein
MSGSRQIDISFERGMPRTMAATRQEYIITPETTYIASMR